MKRIICLFILLSSTFFYAQSTGINYQAVLYNPSGEILPGNNNMNAVLSQKDICLRFSIANEQSVIVYQETQKVKTDEFGMVNLMIGTGNQIGGFVPNFDAIVWNKTTKKLQVAIDITGNCTNFTEISNQDFSAVPFAFSAKTTENISGIVAIANGGTGASTVSGAKNNLGLDNVDNTSDTNKPISWAAQLALNGKENLANKSTDVALGTSNDLYPTQNAVKKYVDNQISSGVVDAEISVKGKIKLAGDLAGTADAPTVPALATKENTIPTGTALDYFRGDKTWQTLDKSAIGLSQVDNTSDVSKPISSLVQTALNGKENIANKSTDVALGTSNDLYPTQNAVKKYVDNQISSNVVDADSSVKGKIKLAGDLAGTADAPTVPALATKENTIATGTALDYFRGDKTWQTLDKSTVGLSQVDNTSDASKPISTLVQTALNGKENLANKSTDVALGTSNDLYPTQNAVKKYVDNQISSNVVDADSSVKGKIKLAGDLAGTADLPKIADAAVTSVKLATDAVEENKIKNGNITTVKIADNAVTNAKIGEIITLNKGGTGADMSNTTAGYVVQETDGANFTTVSSIPVNNVDGAVRSVNGELPNTNGDVSLLIGKLYIGNSTTPSTGGTPAKSDIYIVSGQTSTPNDNGRTFLFDGTNWLEIATNLAPLENIFVKLSGSTMTGDLVVPTGKKITIDDAPTNTTDAVNKDYADTKIKGSGTTSFLPKFTNSKQLENSNLFDDGTNLGLGTTSPNSKFEVVGDIKARNAADTNSIVLNTSLSSLDITSATRTFRFGSFTGATYYSLINGTAYIAGIGGISQLSMNTPGNQPITFATNDWIERMRIQPTTGNVGIGTNAPNSKLEVNGSATNTTALNNATGTTIDFSKSNLAYTTASAGAFTLTNIKDGGTFSLAVQGANSGTSTFTSTGYTFKYINNGITAANKHTIYTFLVMGTTAYVYMATGF